MVLFDESSSFGMSSRLEQVNIALMVFSALLAYFFPFETFVWSFALLSPLHYFSEISWLHGKNFYLSHRLEIALLIVLALVVLGIRFDVIQGNFLIASLLAFGFFMSFIFVITESWWKRLLGLTLTILFIVMTSHLRWYFVIFAVFMTTIIHTALFTGAFILHGALKRRDFWASASLLVFVLCCACMFVIVPESGLTELSPYYQNSYGPFWIMNSELMRLFSLPFESQSDLFQSSGGLMVMRFVSFTYLYHFLNWFSKTSLIGWHRGSKWQLSLVFLSWIACVGIFFWDYLTGVSVIFFFSILHVFLEFPLNHRTFIGIIRQARSRL